jgi:hypothetical protein
VNTQAFWEEEFFLHCLMLKIMAPQSFKMLGNTHRVTQRHVSEDLEVFGKTTARTSNLA